MLAQPTLFINLNAYRTGNRRRNQLRRAHRLKRDEKDAMPVLFLLQPRDFQSEARLANAAWTNQRQ